MEYIEALYFGAGIIAFMTAFPSIISLLRTKRSDELSLVTWVGWFGYQITALLYAIEIGAKAYAILNLLWLPFYVVMITLILKYRKKGKKKKKSKNSLHIHLHK